MVTSMEAKIKEKQAMTLVSGLQADIEALQTQVIRSADLKSGNRHIPKKTGSTPQTDT